MLSYLRSSLRPAISLLIFFTVLTGLAYPLLVTGIAQLAMPGQANGSLIERDGHVIGSRLIGQNFSAPGYFHGRPSAAGAGGYDAAASSGSNLAPGSKALRDRVAADVAGLRKDGVTGPIPADLLTTSASGLDPDISPEAALVQVPRIAGARGLPRDALVELVRMQRKMPLLGFLGESRVNVVALNMQLDALSGKRVP